MRKLAFLLAALAAPLPAAASDPATLNCVAKKLPLLARAQIELDTERNLRETGKRPTYDAKMMAALTEATGACAQENAWPTDALQPAALYTRAELGWAVAKRVASEKGFDAAALEKIWKELPLEEREKPLTMDAYKTLADTAVPEGDDRRTRENGEFLGEFFTLMSVRQYGRFEFAHAGEPPAKVEEPAPEAAAAPEPEAVAETPGEEPAIVSEEDTATPEAGLFLPELEAQLKAKQAGEAPAGDENGDQGGEEGAAPPMNADIPPPPGAPEPDAGPKESARG